ncbi:hypothetical protein OH76DRAFT_1233853 [Lentinus brumalis]|uniref:Uncharacterized protein n=1 Tax=Lentinus brumalis TaxID=2498619 RepID=A0A371CSM6_9APHY|nr:hypothetical protein OH76DRAFT_1233853 [Polyporus brumalis]
MPYVLYCLSSSSRRATYQKHRLTVVLADPLHLYPCLARPLGATRSYIRPPIPSRPGHHRSWEDRTVRSRDFARLDVFSAHSHGRADARRSTQVKRREAVAAVVLGRDAVTYEYEGRRAVLERKVAVVNRWSRRSTHLGYEQDYESRKACDAPPQVVFSVRC